MSMAQALVRSLQETVHTNLTSPDKDDHEHTSGTFVTDVKKARPQDSLPVNAKWYRFCMWTLVMLAVQVDMLSPADTLQLDAITTLYVLTALRERYMLLSALTWRDRSCEWSELRSPLLAGGSRYPPLLLACLWWQKYHDGQTNFSVAKQSRRTTVEW